MGYILFFLEIKLDEWEKCAIMGKKILCRATVLDLGATPEEMAANLYARLREAEKICDRLIIIEPADRTEKMVGVLNRLHKACASVDVPH